MASIESALASLDFDKRVLSPSPTHSPPPPLPLSAHSHKDLLPYISHILFFLNKIVSLFLTNAYSFFAYKVDLKRVSLDYVLFESNFGIVDPSSGLKYDNMLHTLVDAMRSAISIAGGGKGIKMRGSEIEWPLQGDENEVGAASENAKKYNGNLMKMIANGEGTLMSLSSLLHV